MKDDDQEKKKEQRKRDRRRRGEGGESGEKKSLVGEELGRSGTQIPNENSTEWATRGISRGEEQGGGVPRELQRKTTGRWKGMKRGVPRGKLLEGKIRGVWGEAKELRKSPNRNSDKPSKRHEGETARGCTKRREGLRLFERLSVGKKGGGKLFQYCE